MKTVNPLNLFHIMRGNESELDLSCLVGGTYKPRKLTPGDQLN